MFDRLHVLHSSFFCFFYYNREKKAVQAAFSKKHLPEIQMLICSFEGAEDTANHSFYQMIARIGSALQFKLS